MNSHQLYHLLVRRPVSGGELAYFTCHAPVGTTVADLVAVTGAKWAIEECFQATKNDTGMDHYQVRRYDAWYRHATFGDACAGLPAGRRGSQGAPVPDAESRIGLLAGARQLPDPDAAEPSGDAASKR